VCFTHADFGCRFFPELVFWDLCLFVVICILLYLFHSLPFGSCFKLGFLSFVGRDFLSLVHNDGRLALFLAFVRCSCIWCFVLVLFFWLCNPFGDCFSVMKKKALCFKKKKNQTRGLQGITIHAHQNNYPTH
jgi:hypothetical protein